MIKFFRRIRQRLVIENKLSKYLFYALGEIVLVVIGILIALYINNWNQDRLLKMEELKSLKFLQAEFEGNLEKFDITFHKQTARFEAINKILFADLSKTNLNQLDSLYALSFYSWTYNPSFSTYNALVTSGKMNQFTNDSLKIKLSEFKDLVADYKEDEDNLWDHSREHLFQQEIYKSKMLSETKFSLRPRTPQEELNDKLKYLEDFRNPQYRNQLTIAILHLELVMGEGNVLREELIALKNSITHNLNEMQK